MLEEKQYKNDANFMVFEYKNADGKFLISFEDNFNLYWSFILNDQNIKLDSYDLLINDSNTDLYNSLSNLMSSIENKKPFINYAYLSDKNKNQIESNNDFLYKNDVVLWKTDNEKNKNNDSFMIKRCDNDFIINFNKNIKDNNFSIRIGNAKSKYSPYNTTFMYMYEELIKYYKQIENKNSLKRIR